MKTAPLTLLTGASRGMGLAMAEQLLQQGHQLITIARQRNAALDELAAKLNMPLQQWQHDLATPAVAAAALRDWLQSQDPTQFTSVTLINNAGVIPPIAPLADSDWSAVSNGLRVGLEAPMLLTSAFLQATENWTLPRKVLNISSGLGRRAIASQATYCAAKAGMDIFSASVALDEAAKPYGARVCALAPGVIDTDMQVQLRSSAAANFPDVARFAQLHATGNLTSPRDAAARVLAWLERPDFGQPVVADVRQG